MNPEIAERESLAYSLAQAAAACGISKRSLEAYIATGRLKSRKIGGRRIILRKDLLAFLNHDQPFAAPGKKADVQ